MEIIKKKMETWHRACEKNADCNVFWFLIYYILFITFEKRKQESLKFWVVRKTELLGKFSFSLWNILLDYFLNSPRILYCPCDSFHLKYVVSMFRINFCLLLKILILIILTMRTKLGPMAFFIKKICKLSKTNK